MTKNFFTADLHSGHSNIIKFCKRPFENIEHMDEMLIQNWNSVVSNNDNIYLLGDLSFRKEDYTNKFLDQLNGQKFLVKGNHDHHLKSSTLKRFAWVKDYYELKIDDGDKPQKIVLFHFPIQTWNKCHYGSYHFHGHVHSSVNECKFRRYDVGVDANNYTPIEFNDIKEKLTDAALVPHHYYVE